MNGNFINHAATKVSEIQSVRNSIESNFNRLDESLRRSRNDKMLSLMVSNLERDKEKLRIKQKVDESFITCVNEIEKEVESVLRFPDQSSEKITNINDKIRGLNSREMSSKKTVSKLKIQLIDRYNLSKDSISQHATHKENENKISRSKSKFNETKSKRVQQEPNHQYQLTTKSQVVTTTPSTILTNDFIAVPLVPPLILSHTCSADHSSQNNLLVKPQIKTVSKGTETSPPKLLSKYSFPVVEILKEEDMPSDGEEEFSESQNLTRKDILNEKIMSLIEKEVYQEYTTQYNRKKTAYLSAEVDHAEPYLDEVFVKTMIEGVVGQQLRQTIITSDYRPLEKVSASLPGTPKTTPPPSPSVPPSSQTPQMDYEVIKTPPNTPPSSPSPNYGTIIIKEPETFELSKYLINQEPLTFFTPDIPSSPKLSTPANSHPSSPREKPDETYHQAIKESVSTPVQTPSSSPKLEWPEFLELPPPKSVSAETIPSPNLTSYDRVSVCVGPSQSDFKALVSVRPQVVKSESPSSSISSTITSFAPEASSESMGQIISLSVQPIDITISSSRLGIDSPCNSCDLSQPSLDLKNSSMSEILQTYDTSYSEGEVKATEKGV